MFSQKTMINENSLLVLKAESLLSQSVSMYNDFQQATLREEHGKTA